jgi:hypothetical protein
MGTEVKASTPDAVDELLRETSGAFIERYRPSGDHRVQWIVAELAPARHAFARSLLEISVGDSLGHLLFLRLVAETTIRLGWIASHRRGGLPAVRDAIDALSKRDLMHLEAAQKRLGENTTAVDAAIREISAEPAPRQIEQLAGSTTLGSDGHFAFRLCSALVHPGLGLRGLPGYPPDMTRPKLRDTMLSSTILASEIVACLEGKPAPLSVTRSLLEAQPSLEFSPSACFHRLRYALVDALGDRAPSVLTTAVGVFYEGRESKEEFSIEARIEGHGPPRTIHGSGATAEEAFAAALASATEPRKR